MENLVIHAKRKFTLDKYVSSVKVSATNDIKSILNVSAKSVISLVEQAGNIVTCSGKVVLNVLYLNQENQIETAEGALDFVQKQQVQTQLVELFAKDEPTAIIDTYSGSEILCSVTHNTQIYGICKHEIADFVGENTSFVLNKKSFNSQKFVTSASESFVVAEEQESNILSMQVLSANAKVLAYNVLAGAGKVVVEGKLLIETIYKDLEGAGLISKEIEFKQEIEANDAMPNMLAEAFVEVRNVTVTPEEKQDKTNIVYALDVYSRVYVYDENTYELASDMFSLDSEIQNTYDYLEVKNYSNTREITDMIMSSTDVSNIENFDDIVGVYFPKIKINNVSDSGEKAYAEGEIAAFALYKSGEMVKRLEVVKQVKFEFEKDVSEICDEVQAEAEISSFKVKAGKDLEVAFKVSARALFSCENSECYVKSFEIKDEKPVSVGGIKVYVTKKGETLFDVAKVLSVRPEIIEEQNEIDGVFEQGEKIYVYSPANL